MEETKPAGLQRSDIPRLIKATVYPSYQHALKTKYKQAAKEGERPVDALAREINSSASVVSQMANGHKFPPALDRELYGNFLWSIGLDEKSKEMVWRLVKAYQDPTEEPEASEVKAAVAPPKERPRKAVGFSIPLLVGGLIGGLFLVVLATFAVAARFFKPTPTPVPTQTPIVVAVTIPATVPDKLANVALGKKVSCSSSQAQTPCSNLVDGLDHYTGSNDGWSGDGMGPQSASVDLGNPHFVYRVRWMMAIPAKPGPWQATGSVLLDGRMAGSFSRSFHTNDWLEIEASGVARRVTIQFEGTNWWVAGWEFEVLGQPVTP